ncbi:MAG: hypothetical protein WCK89_03265 [bacterium]
MKSASYFVVLLLSVVCVVLSIALVFTAQANQRVQARVQAKQKLLNSGILGPQGQQIGNSLLQDMASTAARSAGIRRLLEKHGYQIQPAETPSVGTNVSESASARTGQGEGQEERGASR